MKMIVDEVNNLCRDRRVWRSIPSGNPLETKRAKKTKKKKLRRNTFYRNNQITLRLYTVKHLLTNLQKWKNYYKKKVNFITIITTRHGY